MSTAIDIITRALRSINVLGESETASAAQASDGLDSLNAMIADWSNEKLLVFQDVEENFPFVAGQANYTMGTGGSFNTTRPTAIVNCFVRWQTIDYPVEIVTMEQFNEIVYKANQSQVPFVVYVDTSYPLTTLKFWTVPNDATARVYITSRKPLTEYTSLTDPINLPPGYERALRMNLAADLMPEYGLANQLLLVQASNIKRNLKRINYTPIMLDIDSALPQGRNEWNGWWY